jgi:hypothetical protein
VKRLAVTLRAAIAACVLFIVAAVPAFGQQQIAGSSAADPFVAVDMPAVNLGNAFNNLQRKTEVLPPTGGTKRLLLISTGQSNGGNPNYGIVEAVGSISGTTMTITTASAVKGQLTVGQTCYDDQNLIAAGTRITALGTGTGATGTYTVNNSQTFPPLPATSGTIRCRYTPANPNAIYNLNWRSGGLYLLTDPVLGAGGPGGSFIPMLADQLVTDGKASSVVVMSLNVGGSVASRWAPGGDLYSQIARSVARWTAKTNYQATHCIIFRHQGESDNGAGTSQAAYFASLSGEITQWRAVAPSCAIFVGQVSFFNNTTSANVTNAQAAAVNNTSVFSGGNFDTIGCSGREVSCIDYVYQGNVSAAAIAKVPVAAWLDAH